MYSAVFSAQGIEDKFQKSLTITTEQVQKTLNQTQFTPNDLPVLLSPAASQFIETMAQKAHHLTIQRFGKTMQLFAPMYISNVCYNTCTYCGFSMENDYPRITLTPEQIIKEGLFLKNRGFQHILILTGEADQSSVAMIEAAIQSLAPHFASIGIEIQPLNTDDYHKLVAAGVDSLTVYQETYHPESYAVYHPRGKKRNFTYRLDTPDRAGKTGLYKLNIGALLGLYEWRYEALAVADHLSYLEKKYWQNKYSLSFPRIKDMVGEFNPKFIITDRDYTQLICAMRLAFPDTGLTLSTRESAAFRDALFPLGITTMSAESNTAPGGYTQTSDTEKQFETSDHRSLEEVQALLMLKGYEPVFKDWEAAIRG